MHLWSCVTIHDIKDQELLMEICSEFFRGTYYITNEDPQIFCVPVLRRSYLHILWLVLQLYFSVVMSAMCYLGNVYAFLAMISSFYLSNML